jgi:hypothetical protein
VKSQLELARHHRGDTSLEFKLELHELNGELADFDEELADVKKRQGDLNLKKKIFLLQYMMSL